MPLLVDTLTQVDQLLMTVLRGNSINCFARQSILGEVCVGVMELQVHCVGQCVSACAYIFVFADM